MLLVYATTTALALAATTLASDPCAAIAGQKWVAPSAALRCLRNFPVDDAVKVSTIQTLNRTLAFHTSVNYQLQAPAPFADVHEDIHRDLARIQDTEYSTAFDLHLDLYYSFRRLADGHCTTLNLCFDSLYISYLPTPLVLLTDSRGVQNVHIAPEAFTVASAEFPDQIDVWQDALNGQLESLSGAKVLKINGEDPFVAVNANALVTGGYQGFGTRQNSFFSSYSRGSTGWSYVMGNFAQLVHPVVDSVSLTIQRVNSTVLEDITIPYRSRFGSASKNFTDSASFSANNCVARKGTNGISLYDSVSVSEHQDVVPPIAAFEQQPRITAQDRKHAINVQIDALPLWDIDLPEQSIPAPPALNESYSVAQFYLLDDDPTTGVLALGSFSAANFTAFMGSLLDGLTELKARGARRLIVDVTNNGGGYICIAHWLHRIIIGPMDTTEPQAGLYTTIRAGPLAQLIVEKINSGGDPDELLSYNPVNWRNSSNQRNAVDHHWLRPTVNVTVNGREDAFSPQLGAECQPFEMKAPSHGLFKPENIAIVSNGRCASSCSLFSITMSKHHGVKTVVFGGDKRTRQQYCGVVGGQSTNSAEIDTEIKSTGLKKHELAPPDFQTNSIMGITWRLGFGIDDPTEPEEWQDHPATFNLPLTAERVNKPSQLWNYVAETVFADSAAVLGDGEAEQRTFSLA